MLDTLATAAPATTPAAVTADTGTSLAAARHYLASPPDVRARVARNLIETNVNVLRRLGQTAEARALLASLIEDIDGTPGATMMPPLRQA
jgi:hypothetical protein